MAKRGGGSGRKYVRDAKGRFAGKGFSGQTGGRGARLKAKGKKRDGGGAIVKPKRIGEMKNTISKSSSKRKVNASSRATDRQIARDIAARSKPTAARTSKSTAGRAAKAKYQAATSSARKASMLAGGRASSKGLKGRTDAGAANIRASVKSAQAAKRKVRKMEETRGAKKKA
jgi:hypothetical protein